MKIKYIGKCLLIEDDREKVLVLCDLHLGYEEALNKRGVMVGRKSFKEIIEYLKNVFLDVRIDGKIDKVVLLGDLKHELGEINNQEKNDLIELVKFFKEKSRQIIIVKGNHDNFLLNLKENVKIKEYYIWKEIMFLHGNKKFEEVERKKVRKIIMGHLHPAIVIRENVKSEKYKCYLIGMWKGKEIIVMPSFSERSIGIDVREIKEKIFKFNFKEFKLKVIGESEIYDFGYLKNLKI